MAMSGTGTMSNNPNEWLQFYNQLSSSQAQVSHGHISSGINTSTFFGHDQVSEATVVTTTPSAVATTSAVGSANPGSSTNSLSPDQGRVSKPARKRSRASRRTPTTLLNTDTTNFRAMVQQFTGGPNTASFPSGGSSFSFGLAPPRPQGFMVSPGYHPLQPQQHQQHHQYQQQQQRQNQQYLVGAGVGDGFLQRLSSSSSRGGPTTNMGFGGPSDHVVDHHEFLREGMSSSQVPSAARPGANAANENRSGSFMF
ncbi:PREDICTED: VQ [Prunus dulcis]|uniref:PREDICTED: VQ n=1 Tax=Prunus dulcis TaxID=3755 RepID=A0A5E4FIB4_PRUDU|nr:VQ motif-containing protein 22 [Prunus dulcis]VVA27833.1 PREDICTED: VQ [Prunus dulcis]